MDTDNIYSTLDIQKKLLELIKEFHRFCITNDIKYSLDWGSLLGAIRHKGFIPWDDDLDIMVDRVNYEKIKNSIGGQLFFEHGTPEALWVDRVRLESDSVKSPKPTMDVFIIDNAPDGKLARMLRVLLIRALQGMLKNDVNLKKGNVIFRMASLVTFLVGRCVPRKVTLTWYDKLSQLSNNRETQMKACYNADFGDVAKLRHPDVIGEYILVPFEDCEVYVTKGYHQALVDMFGLDYMTPPSENKRIPQHI